MTEDQRLSTKRKSPAGESEPEDEHDESSTSSPNSPSPCIDKTKARFPGDALGFTKPPRIVGPMDKYVRVITDEERLNKVKESICRWVCESGIPFHVLELDSFKLMVEAIARCGPGFTPPTRHEMSELFKEEVERTKGLLETHEAEWRSNGCSIMIDAWSDRNRSVMNLWVNSKLGILYLSSKESSDIPHTITVVRECVEKCIQQVGPRNVVQIVTDGAPNIVIAAKLLKQNRPSVFWSSCAALTINLMLESIASLPRFKKVLDQAKELTTFIYGHHKTLAMMRSHTENRDIVSPGVTGFASSFLTLQSLLEKKIQLMAMFASDECYRCKIFKTVRGEASQKTAFSMGFWNRVASCLKVFEPLVKVLRIVIDDRKPSMGFVYGELLQAKEDIKKALPNDSEKYGQIIEIIDARIKGKLDSPLHLMAYFLNPYYHYKDPLLHLNKDVSLGIIDCLEVMFDGDIAMQHKIINDELLKYRQKESMFGKAIAMRSCAVNFDKFDPVAWWSKFGIVTPNLQKMALKILSLVSSLSGCERNRSAFDGVYTTKMNRLGTNRLNKLAFVQLNARLLNKQKREANDKNIEVLLASNASHAQDWIVNGSSRFRELDDDDFESDEEEGINKNDSEFPLEFESD